MINLLIIGIKWPPETFIQLKINSLINQGVRVSVAATIPARRTGGIPKGWQLVRLVHLDDPLPARLFQLVSRLIKSAIRHKGVSQIRQLWQLAMGEPFRAKILYLHRFLTLADLRTDCVHFEWVSAALTYAPFVEQILQVPYVISFRGKQVNVNPNVPGNESKNEKMRRVFAKVAAFHCVSADILDSGISLGADPRKATIIRPAVDTRQFTPSQQAKGKGSIFRIISVGGLTWIKGYEYALMTVRELKDRGEPVDYTIIGNGEEINRIRFTIHDLDLEEQVHLLGKQSPEQVLKHLQHADAFLLASLSEGISNAVLEAMAVGLPVVTTDCGGMREAVSDGVEGFVVPVREPEIMADRLAKLWENAALRASMGAAARERAVAQFDLAQQSEEWLALYSAVLEGKRSA